MEQREKEPESVRLNREQISEIIAQYDKKHGLTIKEFCKLKGISEGLFYSTRSRQRSLTKNSRKRTGFITIKPSPSQQSATLFAEVRDIKIYQAVPADYLKALVS